jgi:hypothetical protein
MLPECSICSNKGTIYQDKDPDPVQHILTPWVSTPPAVVFEVTEIKLKSLSNVKAVKSSGHPFVTGVPTHTNGHHCDDMHLGMC